MKKALSLLLAFVLCLTLCACSISGVTKKAEDLISKIGEITAQISDVPRYLKDLIQGFLGQSRSTSEPTDVSVQSATTQTPETIACNLCGASFAPSEIRDGYCRNCYAQAAYHETDEQDYYECYSCGREYTADDLYNNLCYNCYRDRFALCTVCNTNLSEGYGPSSSMCAECYYEEYTTCVSCGCDSLIQDMYGEYCSDCYANKMMYCTRCGREYDLSDDIYDGSNFGGLCFGCYHTVNNLCINCSSRPNEGYGPSGMECSECYYEAYATCAGCGYDYSKENLYNGYCNYCHRDPLIGTFYADYENVRITITSVDGEYHLSYTDLTSNITLNGIPHSYADVNTVADSSVVFLIDDYYPEYSGYVEFWVYIGARASYTYNALIDGLEDTDGYYSSLTAQ